MFKQEAICIGERWGECVMRCVFDYVFVVSVVWDVCGIGSRCILCVCGAMGLYCDCAAARHTGRATPGAALVLESLAMLFPSFSCCIVVLCYVRVYRWVLCGGVL